MNGETEEVGDKVVVDEEVKKNEERGSMPLEAVTGDNQDKPEEEVNRGDPLDASPQQIRELQQGDESLRRVRDLAEGGVMDDSGNTAKFQYRGGFTVSDLAAKGIKGRGSARM